MKLYISLDMEGIAGTYNWDQETKDKAGVIFAIKKQMEFIIQAIHESPQNKIISDIIIADSHSTGDNLPWSFSDIDERISLISGSPRPFYMMPALSADIDRIFLIGYHAGCGALAGNMDHTYSNRRIHRIMINGINMNEALLNSAFASCFNIPVTLVSGDNTLKNELLAEDKMPWLEYIETKKSISKFSAMNYSLAHVKKSTVSNVIKALEKDRSLYPLYRFDNPITMDITFNSTSFADVAQMIPYSKRIDGRTVQFSCDDYKIIFETMTAMVTLSYTVNP